MRGIFSSLLYTIVYFSFISFVSSHKTAGFFSVIYVTTLLVIFWAPTNISSIFLGTYIANRGWKNAKMSTQIKQQIVSGPGIEQHTQPHFYNVIQKVENGIFRRIFSRIPCDNETYSERGIKTRSGP